MGPSLVQRSRTERDVSECEFKTLTRRRPRPTRGVKLRKKKKVQFNPLKMKHICFI
jgi:hypothetical protein